MFELGFASVTIKAGLVGLAIGYLVYWLMQKLKYNLPPGPFPLPLIGNVHQIKTEMIHEQFYKWSLKYGPVISVYLRTKLCVVVNDLDTIMEVLVKKGTDFAGRKSSPSIDYRSDGGKNIIFAQYGPTLKLHRRLASNAIRHYLQGESLEKKVHSAVLGIEDDIKSQTEPIEPERYVNFVSSYILMAVTFGKRYKFNDPDLKSLIEAVDEMFTTISVGFPEDKIPGFKYIYESKQLKKMKSLYNILKDFIDNSYQEHIRTFQTGTIRDIADTLILAKQEAEEDPEETDVDKLTDAYIALILLDILFGGIETSRVTFRYLLLHMAAYPEIQTKVQEEIDSVVGPDELPRIEHRSRLSYTEATLHESMRLASVTPIGIPHVARCDTSIAGYAIPKKTIVFTNLWALHHDPTKWEDVDDFKPERFLDKDGKLGPKPASWLPFSAGRRVCLGKPVAKPEFLLIFACLMQRFKLQLPDGVKADLYPDRNVFGIVPKPHKMLIKLRHQYDCPLSQPMVSQITS